MSVKPAKIQFNGGELSPWLEGRTDIAKYDKTAKLCRNFIPLTEGSMKRRGGSRFVAQTPEATAVVFSIQTVPVDAEVLINGTALNTLEVALGDTVNYEVSARGYVTASGQITVTKDITLNVVLVSLTKRCRLSIEALPMQAVVKIAGYERNIYYGVKGENVPVTVYCDNCSFRSEVIKLDTGLHYAIILEPETDDSCSYGDWGVPLCFVSCSAYGHNALRKKCFLIKFTNGYLPIIFDAEADGPGAEDVDENLFIYNTTDGYNAVFCAAAGGNYLAVICYDKKMIYYRDLAGNILAVFKTEKNGCQTWALDDDSKPATVYKFYDGYLVNKTIKVHYKGNLVWSMKGRKNG